MLQELNWDEKGNPAQPTVKKCSAQKFSKLLNIAK
jgi:hypothetical protein